MDVKARPNHRKYVEILRRMTPAQRLDKSFELTEHARELMKARLRRKHPQATPEELQRLFLDRMKRYHNAKAEVRCCGGRMV